ncbi:MAG: uroporphyrinogen decarboxylase family protein [Thermanaerothrix sp.]|uniref:uroporphyrinogen decarboxylase family protein n=1 Tax=Thermanaerothrix sp. TaxID=2972675 RepID=UPI003C7AE5BA
MKSNLARMILGSSSWLPLPICTQTGTQLIGASIRDLVSNTQVQTEAILALQEYLGLSVLMTPMDLSIEAEMFGCEIAYYDNEIPTVVGKAVKSLEDIRTLSIPQPGCGRSRISLETVYSLTKHNNNLSILGCMIGPFSLAIRLIGANEALELTATYPEMLDLLLEKLLSFQIEYAKAFRSIGACGILIAEPAAGLLSPRAMSRFSSRYVRQLISSVSHQDFTVILHNCGARLVHLPALLEAEAEIYHFGAPMDLEKAFYQVGQETILGGNLDPYKTFIEGTELDVEAHTKLLLKATRYAVNFIPSSGCDLPAHTPLANIKTFVKTVNSFAKKACCVNES